MHVLAQVIKIQAQTVQLRQMVLQLLADPWRFVQIGNPFARFSKAKPVRFPPHQSSRGRMIQVRHCHMLVLHPFVVEVGDLEFFPVSVRPLAQRWQRTPLLSAFAPLLLTSPAASAFSACVMIGTMTHRNRCNSRFAGHQASFLKHRAVGRSPSGIEGARLLCVSVPPSAS